jgi:16S rRNA (guanine527-N7)-methyltransferase
MSELATALAAHRSLLEKWRKTMDLVGPGPIEPHFVDAVACVQGLAAEGRWADLGSGAGFPGIALAGSSPLAQIELVESREKRAAFLQRVVREAGLGSRTTVRNERSEALPDGVYDGLISRAYKPPLEFLEDAARLLKPGGRVVLLLGDGPSPAWPPGFAEEGRLRYPVVDGHRIRVVLRWMGGLGAPGSCDG